MQKYSLLLALVASLLGSSQAGPCYRNDEHFIGGRCYQLVNQKLSFEDARYWCRYQNPSTFSYLATVPDQTTANFLASYAVTTFGNDNNIWIGLSRPTGKYQWDSGYPVGWTNFAVQNSGVYVAESPKNGKWSTFGADAKFNFVCSYDPTAPYTSHPTSTTTSPNPTTSTEWSTTSESVPRNCRPSDPIPFLLAYSNDVNNSAIFEALHFIDFLFTAKYRTRPFAHFASVRFDVQVPEGVRFFEKLNDLVASVNSTLTNPSLSFKNVSAPTDAIDIVRGFVEKYPVCGTTILLLVKRNSDPQDISDTVRLLQTHHFIVYIAAPDVLIGGSTSTPLYELSTRTNGICSFDWTLNNVQEMVYRSAQYPVYSANVRVHGQGKKLLPVLAGTNFEIAVTGQGHPLTNDYFEFSLVLNFITMKGTNPNLKRYSLLFGTLMAMMWSDSESITNVTLTYDYPTTTETLQIRVTSDVAPSDWPSYDNNY